MNGVIRKLHFLQEGVRKRLQHSSITTQLSKCVKVETGRFFLKSADGSCTLIRMSSWFLYSKHQHKPDTRNWKKSLAVKFQLHSKHSTPTRSQARINIFCLEHVFSGGKSKARTLVTWSSHGLKFFSNWRRVFLYLCSVIDFNERTISCTLVDVTGKEGNSSFFSRYFGIL